MTTSKIFQQNILFNLPCKKSYNTTSKLCLTHSPSGICLPFSPCDRNLKSSYIMLPDFLRLQKVILNHSGISGLTFSIFIFILHGIYTFIYTKQKNRSKPFISPDYIALADPGREVCSLVYNSRLLSSQLWLHESGNEVDNTAS